MRRVARLAYATMCLLGMTISAQAAPIDLRRGIGVHDWLNWAPINTDANGNFTTYRWPPYRTYDEWLSGERPLSDWPAGDQFVRIKSMGFDFVRLAVDPGPLLATSEEWQQQARQDVLDVLEAAVKHVTASGLKVVLDLHAAEQVPYYGWRFIYDTPDSQNIAVYRAMVRDVATMLVTKVGTSKVAIEPFNEPPCYGDSADWQQIMAATAADIRKISIDLTIVATGACGGGIDGLVLLDPIMFKPADPTKPSFLDPNILYSFHMYEPFTFTHQRPDPDIGTTFSSGLPWPAAPHTKADWVYWMKVNMTAAGLSQAEQQMNLDKQDATVTEYFNQNWGQAQLTARFKLATDWAAANSLPNDRLFMGEFGAILMPPWANMGAYEEDRSAYIRAVRLAAQTNGIRWSTWEYANATGMSLIVRRLFPVPEYSPAVPDEKLLSALGLLQ